MNKNKVWSFICITGIPWFIISFLAFFLAKRWYCANMTRRPFEPQTLGDFKDLILYAVFLNIWVVLKNTLWLGTNKQIGLFTWLEKYHYEPPAVSSRKLKAMHPIVDEEYLSDKIEGLVLGKQGKKYVRFPITKGHALSAIILGTPGSGKSTLLLTSLISNLNRKLNSDEERQTYFVVDVKPELMRKSTLPKTSAKELSIQNRDKNGWDCFYALDACSSDDDILDELDVIARALIDEGKAEKNAFFYTSARTIFKFVALERYKKGKSFIQIIDYIMGSDMSSLVINTLEKAEMHPELLKVKKGLAGYKDKQGEAFQGIELAFREALDCLQRDDCKYFLDGNPSKISPLTLEDHVSIFFTVSSKMIKKYKTILRLVIMQIIYHCEGRDEDKAHLITFIIDEAYRFGVINWIDFLSICRSKQISCVLAFQSLSQMQSVWSKEDATSLTEMVSAIAVLSCSDPATQKMICDWAPEYIEEKINVNQGGKNDGSYSRSFEYKKVLTPADLMAVKRKKEVVLFLDGAYYMVPVENAKYYKIKKLREFSEYCVAVNKKAENKQGGIKNEVKRD